MGVETLASRETDLDRRVLKAARTLFFGKGFYATSTLDIARQAGTSESGLFRKFESKYALLMAVYNDCWAEVNAEIERRLADYKRRDPRDRILEILRIAWSLYSEKPLLMSFVIINTGNTDTLLVAKLEKAIISDENLKYIERLENLCWEAQNQGLLPKQLSVRALREGLLGITEGILLGWYLADHTEGRYPEKVTIEEALQVAGSLLGRAPSSPADRRSSRQGKKPSRKVTG